MTQVLQNLIAAQKKAQFLFSEIENRKLLEVGKTEEEINKEIYQLAFELFGIKKYWHKRIVRTGENTLCPYKENPPNIFVQNGDIIFLDFGPIFDEWEADFGRSYLMGEDEEKEKMLFDIEILWKTCRDQYFENPVMTGKELYEKVCIETKKMGYIFVPEHSGHLIGIFPHENIEGEAVINYICPENTLSMTALGTMKTQRFWILEMHIRHPKKNFGAFFEQMLI